MLEYDTFINIIDYKLKNIDDIAYQKQLFGYQHYIQNISKKQVHIYLYSVIHHTYKQLDSFSEVEER